MGPSPGTVKFRKVQLTALIVHNHTLGKMSGEGSDHVGRGEVAVNTQPHLNFTIKTFSDLVEIFVRVS